MILTRLMIRQMKFYKYNICDYHIQGDNINYNLRQVILINLLRKNVLNLDIANNVILITD